MEQTKMRILRIIHALLWVIWALLVFTYSPSKTKTTYDRIFGDYVTYKIFYWFQIAFMFGAGILLLMLLIKILPERFAFVAYLLFELIFLTIIIIQVVVFANQ